MLNELYHLSVALEDAGIKPRDWHKNLKPLPNATRKKPCYKILIDVNGTISGLETINEDLVTCLRKWEPSNGNSFPGFNIQPLYRITDEVTKKRLKKWREGKESIDIELLKVWCTDKQINWDAKFDKKMGKCLGTIPEDLNNICANIPPEFAAIKNLCGRVTRLGDGGSARFFQALESFIWDTFGKATVPSLLSVLIHEGSSRKKAEADRGAVSVFMDVPDWKEYPIASKDTIDCINKCLMNLINNDAVGTEKGSEDAFGGGISGFEEKLPEVKLPIIGGVKLRAMSSELPCQDRYGTIDAKSFNIGSNSRRLAKGALEWLSASEREGLTWGRADGKELIFAYPAILPKTPPKLAACFGARKADDSEERFAYYAKDVLDCLRVLAPSLKELKLHVFSLRKMDKARTKIVFHRNYSAQRLADAASEWQKGCANIPVIRMKAWGEEKGKTIMAETETPFPLQIADCLNRVWKLDGTSKCEVKSIPKSAGIELLLDEAITLRHVPYLLTVALQNSSALFVSIGQALHRNEVIHLDGFNKHKQLMPAILGILLMKIGIRKESYMNNTPYLVGRMLKVADELHAVYCKEVRKDNLPPQLLGNALMSAALDSPTQALSQLALRIVPYLGWARTNSTASAGLSRYFLKEFGNIEAKLRDINMPLRLDDAAKAQLLLGYIAGNTQTEEPTNKI
ncbi:MAG: hypothetical protein CVU71_06505 [Deltaproteobacteria bacterium HGW-Deltaproteobacteria-6]|jgi:hypothetical protein|nr:MAG: hypothetical protein CVU71_06505 [Deltaproteobacteria bacterium HGW-Deltaproteobacteria-6]